LKSHPDGFGGGGKCEIQGMPFFLEAQLQKKTLGLSVLGLEQF
jgi:hypothetical protein